MSENAKTGYVAPKVETLEASQVLAALGPAAAGSQKTKACGFPMGPACS